MRTNTLCLYTASLMALGSIPFAVTAAEAVSIEQSSTLPQYRLLTLGIEAGTTGAPEVSLTRSGPPSAAADAALLVEQNRIQDYANQFKWWPVVKLMVTYSF